ncbi:MAG: hypothetical protein QM758_12645 [Armatimonas sp.]
MFARWSMVLMLGSIAGIAVSVGCGGGGGGGGATPTPFTTPTPTPNPGGTPTPTPEPTPTPTPVPTPTPTPTPVPKVSVSFGVDWPARSRALIPPASARSFRLSVTEGTGSVVVTGNRRSEPDGYTETYASAGKVGVGRHIVSIEFFADPNGVGALVATGAADVTITADGSGIGTITLTGTIRSTEVAGGQSVGYGQRKDLGFGARNAAGELLAVSPGSAFATVTAGSERLRLARGIEIEGLRPGTAQVNVTIDGITSPVTAVTVFSSAQVSVSPDRVEVGAGKAIKFTGGVVGAEELGLDWSAPGGGAVTADGTFTAPSTVGEYPVIATSQWDPAKKAQATAVVVPSVTVSPASATTTLRKTVSLGASVLGPANTGVRWSVTEAGGGSVNASGIYTAPATPGVFHVVAESQADSRQKAMVTVTVQSGNGNIHIQ